MEALKALFASYGDLATTAFTHWNQITPDGLLGVIYAQLLMLLVVFWPFFIVLLLTVLCRRISRRREASVLRRVVDEGLLKLMQEQIS